MDNYYTRGEREYLLRIARETLDKFVLGGEQYEPQTLNQKLWEKGGVIVRVFDGKEVKGEATVDNDEAIIVAIRDAIISICKEGQFSNIDESNIVNLKIEITLLVHSDLKESTFRELTS